MSGYSFSIVTYDRGERWDDPTKKKPYHWSFFLQTTTTSGFGHAFQLRGMPGAFYYSGEESVDLSRSGSKNGQLEVGFVPVKKYNRFKQLLEAVPIDNVESSGWNCQSWSLAALDWLRAEGLVAEEYPNNVIQYWLREDQ
jgi:hypothetical protein